MTQLPDCACTVTAHTCNAVATHGVDVALSGRRQPEMHLLHL
jgi:hypothetical protein